MTAIIRRPSRLAFGFGTTAFLAAAGGTVLFFVARHSDFESSPTKPRPWAQAEFKALTMPERSKGKPTDPQYSAKCTSPVWIQSDANHAEVVLQIGSPRSEFIPREFKRIEFDAADGYSGPEGTIRVRAIGARTFDSSISESEQFLQIFKPSGDPMPTDEQNANGIKADSREAWNYERDDGRTVLRGFLECNGFQNSQWNFRQVFDSATHVPLTENGIVEHDNPIVQFRATLATVHDTPLVTVIDVASGAMQEYTCPAKAGSAVDHPDFHVEVIGIVNGQVTSYWVQNQKVGNDVVASYSVPPYTQSNCFTVLYRVTPDFLATAFSLEALDADGNSIKKAGRFVGKIPVCAFNAPITEVASLRFFYRPQFNRLLIRMKALPGVPSGNIKPSNLFDVSVPRMVFYDERDMRQFVAESIQFKDISKTSIGYYNASHDIVSPRSLISDFCEKDPKRRKVIVDPVAQTIEFVQDNKAPWFIRVRDWILHP